MLSVEGVKYTTARRVAEDAVNWVFKTLGKKSPPCRTSETALQGAAVLDPLPLAGASVEAEVRRAVQEEMAVKLSDVVFRRSTAGSAGRLTRARLAEIAQLAGAELGWNAMRQQTEVEEVLQRSAALPAEEPVV